MATDRGDAGPNPHTLPFVAPCRELTAKAPLRWLQRGWRDLTRAPRQSLAYGAVMVALSWLVGILAWKLGGFASLIGLASGFVFVGPVLAIGLYSISRQLQLGRKPQLGYCLREGRRHLGDALTFGVMLLIVFLVWARAASMVHVFFPVAADPAWSELAVFLVIGTLVGSLFAGVIFAASAFSLPMIMDRRTDMVTAVVTSINAVLRNKAVMLLWAALIVGVVALGLVTGLLAWLVALPVIGHATWHAYRETVDASEWPPHEQLDGS